MPCQQRFRFQRLEASSARALWFGRAVLPALGSLVACTSFESGADVLVSEVENVAPFPGQDWSCLSTTRPPGPFQANAPTARVVYTVRLLDLATLTPVPDVRVRACALTNLNCDAPVTLDLLVDADGWVDIPLPEGFSGYLEIESPTTIPTLFLIPPELPGPRESEFPGVLPTTADFALLAAAILGRPQAAAEGAIAFRVFDCSWNPAPGVSISADVPGTPYYFQGGLPNPRGGSTDEAGIAGIMGIPPGLITVRMRQRDGLDIAAPRGVIVRAGWMSSTFVKPSRRTEPSPPE